MRVNLGQKAPWFDRPETLAVMADGFNSSPGTDLPLTPIPSPSEEHPAHTGAMDLCVGPIGSALCRNVQAALIQQDAVCRVEAYFDRLTLARHGAIDRRVHPERRATADIDFVNGVAT